MIVPGLGSRICISLALGVRSVIFLLSSAGVTLDRTSFTRTLGARELGEVVDFPSDGFRLACDRIRLRDTPRGRAVPVSDTK
jgi:hypothetical protein